MVTKKIVPLAAALASVQAIRPATSGGAACRTRSHSPSPIALRMIQTNIAAPTTNPAI